MVNLMIKRIIGCIAILCVLMCTGCSQNKIQDHDMIEEYCSAIIDACVQNKESNLLTSECFQQLKAAGNPGGSYDYKELQIWSLTEDGKTICLCNATYTFKDSPSIWEFTYRITFTVTDGKICTAEMINYATY